MSITAPTLYSNPFFFYVTAYLKYQFLDLFGLIVAYSLTWYCLNLTKAISEVVLRSKPQQSMMPTTHHKYPIHLHFLLCAKLVQISSTKLLPLLCSAVKGAV